MRLTCAAPRSLDTLFVAMDERRREQRADKALTSAATAVRHAPAALARCARARARRADRACALHGVRSARACLPPPPPRPRPDDLLSRNRWRGALRCGAI
jgi:hypothetical protein